MEDTLNQLKFLDMLSPRGIHIPNCDKKGFYKKKQVSSPSAAPTLLTRLTSHLPPCILATAKTTGAAAQTLTPAAFPPSTSPSDPPSCPQRPGALDWHLC